MNVNGTSGSDVSKTWNGIWSGTGNKKISNEQEKSFKTELEVTMYVC